MIVASVGLVNRHIKDQISAGMTSLAALLTFSEDYRNYQGNRRLFRTDSLQCSKKVAGEQTCWCPHTLGISCHYKTLLQSKRTPTWRDPETEKRTSNTIKLDANVAFWDKIVKPFLTLLKNEGAASGLLLNSPHTCKSLTQQMASLSSAKVWEPIISRAAWGLMKLNCGGEGTLESRVEGSLVTAMAIPHLLNDIRVENVDGQNDLSLWDHVVHQFWVLADGQTLLGGSNIQGNMDSTACKAARWYKIILIAQQPTSSSA